MVRLDYWDFNNPFNAREKELARKQGRRHIGYPCDEAQDLPIHLRPQHIFNPDGTFKCKKCEQLAYELDKHVGRTGS